jgi:transcription elongation factor Elf1
MSLLLESAVQCPHCGEVFSVTFDTSQGDHSMIEDCTVCCRPIQLEVRCEPGEILDVEVARG